MNYYIGTIPASPELTHHGIKGMKWGVRRYQNPDGRLTAAGQKRYGQNLEETKSVYSKIVNAVKSKVKDSANTEIGKRGKSAVDVLLNGDTDWMGNHTYNDDIFTEVKSRGKAAIERLIYSEEQIDNKKFFGRYDF